MDFSDVFCLFGVGSRALSTGKGLESVAAQVSEFDENSSSFGETCRVLLKCCWKSIFAKTLAIFCFSFRYPTGSNGFE